MTETNALTISLYGMYVHQVRGGSSEILLYACVRILVICEWMRCDAHVPWYQVPDIKYCRQPNDYLESGLRLAISYSIPGSIVVKRGLQADDEIMKTAEYSKCRPNRSIA